MDITPKYNVGNKVYFAGLVTEKRQHDCPDCLGEKKWEAISPAGEGYTFDCPRCSTSYMNNNKLSLSYSVFAPDVRNLTIGSVRIDTARDNPVEYMCFETGVGSGSIYSERDLYDNRDEAEVAAQTKANNQTQTTDWMIDRWRDSLSISDYQLSNARIESAKDMESKMRIKYGWLVSDLGCCYDMDDVAKIIEKLEQKIEAEN